MLDPRIPFKNRYLAGVLAFLFPGAGHVYQGRYFKGILCGTCVLVTFFYGMALGNWSVVYWKKDPTNFLNPYYAASLRRFAGTALPHAGATLREPQERR